ncbi:MAG TPA: hypothetical protein VFS00_28590 [Polyangiaceae bacterium]|nr:hypothetical protein [Polyangiaceae bacterium]
MCPGGQCQESTWEDALDVRSRGDKQALAYKVSLGLGAAGLLAGGYLLFWPTSKEKPRATAARVSLTVAPTPGGLVIGGLF